jgi:hypothetical protein
LADERFNADESPPVDEIIPIRGTRIWFAWFTRSTAFAGSLGVLLVLSVGLCDLHPVKNEIPMEIEKRKKNLTLFNSHLL